MRESIGGRIDGPAYREWLPRSRVLKVELEPTRYRNQDGGPFLDLFLIKRIYKHKKKRNVPIESIDSPLKASSYLFTREAFSHSF